MAHLADTVLDAACEAVARLGLAGQAGPVHPAHPHRLQVDRLHREQQILHLQLNLKSLFIVLYYKEKPIL